MTKNATAGDLVTEVPTWYEQAYREMAEERERANPCGNCGTSNWGCLYEINKGGAHCCRLCDVTDSHGIFE